MSVNPNAIQAIRLRSGELFPDGRVSGSVLVSNIAFGAAALGAGHVEIRDDDDWWFAASEFNWMKPKPPDIPNVPTLFEQAIDFPELGPTSIRPEIYISAFAKRIYVELAGECIPIMGETELDSLPHVNVVPTWCAYVLAFQLGEDSKAVLGDARH